MYQRAVASTQMNWFSAVGILWASPSQLCSLDEYFVTWSTRGILNFSPASLWVSTMRPKRVTTLCSPS